MNRTDGAFSPGCDAPAVARIVCASRPRCSPPRPGPITRSSPPTSPSRPATTRRARARTRRAGPRSPIRGPDTDDVKKTIGHFARGCWRTPRRCRTASRSSTWRTRARPTRASVSPSHGSTCSAGRSRAREKGRIYNQELLARRGGTARHHRRHRARQDLPDRAVLRAHQRRLRARRHPRRPPAIAGIGDIQIPHLGFTLYGTVQGRNFTRGPTSCSLKVSTGDGFAYDHPVRGQRTAPSTYTPTGCEKVPFKPTFDMSGGLPRHHG